MLKSRREAVLQENVLAWAGEMDDLEIVDSSDDVVVLSSGKTFVALSVGRKEGVPFVMFNTIVASPQAKPTTEALAYLLKTNRSMHHCRLGISDDLDATATKTLIAESITRDELQYTVRRLLLIADRIGNAMVRGFGWKHVEL